MSKQPKLSLVGAGPGDPDLLTIKGMKAIQSADVILYDALVDRRLLEYAPVEAIKIYVGKRANKHRFDQQEINRLIVAHAFNEGHVVRLKGGDPFVFGRGQEEKEYAEIFDIEVEVIPGISSAIAVPSAVGIPVTERSVSDSFWVLTATTSHGKLSNDIALAAQSSATVIILMGIRKLPQIISLYKKNDQHDLPVAVIQSGTTQQEKIALGTISTIEEEVAAQAIGTPGIIVIGEVVSNHKYFERQLSNLVETALQNHKS